MRYLDNSTCDDLGAIWTADCEVFANPHRLWECREPGGVWVTVRLPGPVWSTNIDYRRDINKARDAIVKPGWHNGFGHNLTKGCYDIYANCEGLYRDCDPDDFVWDDPDELLFYRKSEAPTKAKKKGKKHMTTPEPVCYPDPEPFPADSPIRKTADLEAERSTPITEHPDRDFIKEQIESGAVSVSGSVGPPPTPVEMRVGDAAYILTRAQEHMQDRATQYDPNGQAERSMGAIVAAFNAVTGLSLTTEQGWLFMCQVKLVRSQAGDYRADNYEDLAAYAALLGEQAATDRCGGAK